MGHEKCSTCLHITRARRCGWKIPKEKGTLTGDTWNLHTYRAAGFLCIAVQATLPDPRSGPIRGVFSRPPHGLTRAPGGSLPCRGVCLTARSRSVGVTNGRKTSGSRHNSRVHRGPAVAAGRTSGAVLGSGAGAEPGVGQVANTGVRTTSPGRLVVPLLVLIERTHA